VIDWRSNDETKSDLCTSVNLESARYKESILFTSGKKENSDSLVNIDTERDLSSRVKGDRST